MSRGRIRIAGAIGVAIAIAAGACGVPEQDSAHFARSADVPFGLLDPATTTTTAPPTLSTTPRPATTPLCFLTAEGRLIIVQRPQPTGDAAEAVHLLEQGPSASERRFGLTSLVTEDGIGGTISAAAGVAHIDLTPLFAAAAAGDQRLAVAQLVCTLTSQPGIGQVSFSLGGAPVDVPRGDGALTPGPVTGDDYAGLLST